jgi:hypothetical protein
MRKKREERGEKRKMKSKIVKIYICMHGRKVQEKSALAE